MAIKLTWYDNNAIEEGYRLYRSDTPMDVANLPEPLVDLAADVREYRDEDVVSGQTYYYRLSAFKNGQEAIGDEIAIVAEELYLGPGSTEFVGGDYATAGFLGEVDTATLISGDDLAAEIGLAAGTSQYSDEPWLKFTLDSKVLFVAKKSYRRGISWDAINAVASVYGDTIIQIGEHFFRVRLLSGSNSDPSSLSRGLNDPAGSELSEWNRLLYKVHADTPTSQRGENWAEYSDNDLWIGGSNTHRTWTQETSANQSNHRVNRGAVTIEYYTTYSSTDSYANYGWRPVLELLPKDYLFPLEINGRYYESKAPILTNGTSETQVREDIQPTITAKYDTFKAPILIGASETSA